MRSFGRRLLAAPGAWPIHLVLAALVLPRAVFLGEALFDRDLHVDWYPRALAFARAVRAGLPPLWDLSIGFGQPFLADPSGQVLYPPTWLEALLVPSTVYTLFALLHLVLAGAGATCLARASGLRRPVATLVGAAWMLSGPIVSVVNLWHHFASVAWMPWVVLAVHRAVRRPGPRAVLQLGACLGLQVLAGSADMVLLTALLSIAWVAGVARLPPRRTLRSAGAVAAGVVLAALLSAGQWIPAVELAKRSARRGLPEAAAAQWSVPLTGLLRLALPLDGSGRVAVTAAAQRTLFGQAGTPLLGSLYVGVVPLVLAMVALVSGRRPRLVVALAVALVAATLGAMGQHAPLFSLARDLLPGASHLRYPSKAMVVTSLAIALLAGHGLLALRRRRPALALGAGALVALGATALAGVALLFGPALGRAFALGLLLPRDGAAEDALPVAARLAAVSALTLLAAALLLRSRARGVSADAAAGVACCVALDLLVAHYDVNATAPVSMLTMTPPVVSAIDRAEGGRAYVYDYAFTAGAAASRLGRDDAFVVAQPPAGIDPRPLAALAMRLFPVPPVLGTWNVESSYDPDLRGLQPASLSALTKSLPAVEGTPAHSALLRMGAVRTIVALHRGGGLAPYPEGPVFPSLFPEPIRTFRVPGALPRARAVGRARAVEEAASLPAVLRPGFDPAVEVVLSGPGAARAAAAARPGASEVRIAELRAERVRIEADLAEPGVVVLADAYDPGWRAWVDGVRTEVLVANVAFRGVAVPAGRHVVEMRYRPASVAIGLGASVVGLVILAALAIPRRRLTPAGASTSSAGSP